MILADGILGQAMEPVKPDFPTAGAAGPGLAHRGRRRAASRGRSARSTSAPRTSRPTTSTLQATYARITEARAALGRRAPRRRRGRARRLRHRGAGRAHRRRAGARAGPPGRPLPADHAVAVPGRRRCATPRAAPAPCSWSRCPPARWSRTCGSRSTGRVPVLLHGRMGGSIPTPDEVVDAARRAWAVTEPDGQPARRDARGRRAMITPQAPAPVEGRTIYKRPALLTNTTSYCPGCGHGIVHRLVAEVLDELGRRRPDDPRRLGRLLGLRVRLPAARRHRVAARTRGRGRDRRQALPARQDRVHLPGRRRPRRHRHRGDRPRGRPRRALHDDLRQQRDLRHDRRPDGPDDAARPEDDVEPGRPRRQLDGLPAPRHRDALAPARRPVRRPDVRRRPGPRRQGEGGHQAGLRGPARGQRLLHRRGPLHVPGRLGHDADRCDGHGCATR